MPRYYFEYSSEKIGSERDEDGVDLPSIEAVREQLRSTLPAFLRDEHGEQDGVHMTSTVRDEKGLALFVARLDFSIESLPATAKSGDRPFP